MSVVPVLNTDRLILRGHMAEDFPAYAAMWGDAAVTRFISGTPLSEEDAWGKFLRAFGHWALLGYGFWAVIERATGARIGEVGFLEGRRQIEPTLVGTPECGWAFVVRAQGKGYATEAMRAALAWGEEHFGAVRLACIIAPKNAASLRVAEKVGFRVAHHTTYKNEPTELLFRDPVPRFK
jgi:RimJ/RimL family protein N-acetyltransferase